LTVELIFNEMQTANKACRGQAGDRAEQSIEEQQQRRGDIGIFERRWRHDESRLLAEE